MRILWTDSCHFKQDEWIFDNESRFFENKNSYSSHNEKMRWDNDTKDDSGQARMILRMVLLSGLSMRVEMEMIRG